MLVIGLISGTSIDAIDAALIEIERDDETLTVAVRAFTMQPFDEALRERVRGLLPPDTGTTVDVCEVNVLLGQAFAEAARAVAQDAGVQLTSVDLIASHGQTVYHQVAPGTVRSTLQLGAPAVIAEQTGCTVVADFRPRDMAVGGEGAPLVPYLDQLLFTDHEKYRALQNIGGIGNVTLLSPQGAELAFDTGPGNVLIDEAVRLLTHGAQTFDRDGRLAAAGQVDQELLAEWLQHPFFDQPPPKSTGREQWGPGEARGYVEQAQARGLRAEDTIATITVLTARSIALAYGRFLPRVDEALIGGGGARNPTLMRMLRSELAPIVVRPVDDFALSADAKEAVAFALMGYATLHGWPGNVPAATGAAQPVVLGSITPGLRYRSLIAQVLDTPNTLPNRARLVDPANRSHPCEETTMPDMLVKLYTLPESAPLVAEQRAAGVDIRRALVPEKHIVVEWVRQTFGQDWASECEIAFARQPVSCFIAVENNNVLGFACYDATYKNFFGPMGVDPAREGRRIGTALLVMALQAQAAEGYAYAIIGSVGPADFYAKTVGAQMIPDSVPGIYRGMLTTESND